MRLSLVRRALTIAGLAASVACAGDGPSAPATPSVDVTGPSLAKAGSIMGRSDVTEVVTVDPTRTRVYHIGQNWIYIPANAVCEPGSSYGVTEWDKPCERATQPFDITVSLGVNEQGYPAAHFTPELRFAPSDKAKRWVVLGLKVKGNLHKAAGYGVLYQPSGSDEWIDESLDDPTLRAWRARGNVIARRLKHFSGYNVSLGFQEQESQLDLGLGGMF